MASDMVNLAVCLPCSSVWLPAQLCCTLLHVLFSLSTVAVVICV